MAEETRPVRVNKDLVKEVKKFVSENGGTIKAATEKGLLWIMTEGAKKYIKSLDK